MTILLAIFTVAAIVWILLPLFGKGLGSTAKVPVEERNRADASDVLRGAVEELELDFKEGKVDPEGYEKAKAELNERLAALGKGGRGKRVGQ